MAEFVVDPDRAEDELSETTGSRLDRGPKYPDMSYEEGVEAALAWVLGERDEPPFTHEED